MGQSPDAEKILIEDESLNHFVLGKIYAQPQVYDLKTKGGIFRQGVRLCSVALHCEGAPGEQYGDRSSLHDLAGSGGTGNSGS